MSLTRTLQIEEKGLPFENLQARVRGALLSTWANSERRLLLATANKSELAMGYSTLYGDLCGALLPIGDLYKQDVITLAREMKISEALVTREPTAELAHNQKDTDSLPRYPELDRFLEESLEGGVTHSDDTFLAEKSLEHWQQRLELAEHKRRQAPPVLKTRDRSFGFGWRMPIAKGRP